MRLSSVAVVAVVAALVGCSGEDAKDAASGVTRKVVEVAKGTATGVDAGIEEGRKSAESVDGALIVSTKDEFADNLTARIIEVRPAAEEGVTEVIAGIANTGDQPVRVTKLEGPGAVVLLDADGYAQELATIPASFTVPPAAKLKVSFCVRCRPADAVALRIHGVDITRDATP